ncbi:hypothetical protein UCDDA912_g06073 [Diaporthe ampelina]|uniref:Uncharacterized protein n=1 Tax=Diaporthe ampelina TaxID=1214573 RepID=A0A0G2FIR0_9PEZI|nr:hypothetical protein UCDDA912_g06073 [Diaporthe ampelina]
MKSTSSRFSFDMMGAARAEKALEERHRQKELERKANNPTSRDSRFDDFDEDSFDYDAAMAEDGFEEDIPMIGDDDFLDDDAFFEEDVPVVGDDDMFETEDDPDNDQENFAGFVFQRSNPQSSLASPAAGTLLTTPRDATGKAIGYAMTKDTTPELQSATSPLANTETFVNKEEGSPDADGLGVQGSEAPRKTQYDPTVFQERRHQPIDDGADLAGTADKELYFDEGLLEELRMEADEIQESTFDESIFDIDDTDQYGRPIPGAFAQAQASRTVQEQEVRKRSQPSSGGQVIDDVTRDEYDEYAVYDDGYGGGFDDNFDDEFEFDDDFIAEANAEALAYDSDGFYGQEFGFYSAPIPQGHHGASKSSGTTLTADNVYGGYFGPAF